MFLNFVLLTWFLVGTVAFVLPLFVLTFEAFRSYVRKPVTTPKAHAKRAAPVSRKYAFAAE